MHAFTAPYTFIVNGAVDLLDIYTDILSVLKIIQTYTEPIALYNYAVYVIIKFTYLMYIIKVSVPEVDLSLQIH